MNKQLAKRVYPEDWVITPLSSFAVEGGTNFVDGPFGSDLKVSDYTESGVRVLQLQNLGDGVFIDDNKIYTTEKKAAQIARCISKPGDLIIAKMAEPLARAAVLPDVEDKYLIVADLIKLRPRDDTNSYYLVSFINFSDFRKEAERLSTGTTRTRISLSTLKRIGVPKPPRAVQDRIGRVLRCIDQEIESTEALIEKYQQIKAGLMHDLFTRGIGADGKLRPPREQAPELYQQTPIGWIPKDWTIKPCAELCTRICVGIVIKPTQYYVEEGIPAFRSANVREDGIDPSNFVYISEVSNSLLAKSQVKEGDLLSVRTGYPGTSAIVPREFGGANCIDILISTPGEQVSSEYLCDWINSPFGKEQVLRQQGGMAQQHFNVGEMKQLLVAFPESKEQKLITGRIQACSDKLRTERELRAKLMEQKVGLMHDLLTGECQVRVVAETAKAEAHV